MSETNIKCRRCETAMVAGYVPDTSRKLVYQTQWYRGVPKQRVWRGKPYGIEDTKDGISMVVYRCPACGSMVLNAPVAKKPAEQGAA